MMNKNYSKTKNRHNNKPGNTTNKRKNTGNRRPARPKKGAKVSKLDPNQLIKKAQYKEIVPYVSERTIESLPIGNKLKQCLVKKGFERPTEIQDRTLEPLMKGRDLLGIAQTGTGKTGAFLIPIIEHLLHHPKKEYGLIIVPTRELALQVNDEFRSMTKGLKLYSACFIGGTNINKDLQTLRRSSHLIIGTPGRLLDLNARRALDFRPFKTLVLDEFDRMLDMGFARDMEKIIGLMQQRQQTMLFSATLDKSQQGMIDEILHQPVTVKVSSGEASADQVDQDIVRIKEGDNKFKILLDLLQQEEYSKVIVFDETKHRVNRLCGKLNKAGIKAEQIQGNKSQNARQKALNAFKKGQATVLVATDVAARGIDVDDVTHVINYQMPMTYDSYIHRIGRTGRAGKVGQALTFVG